MFVKRALKEAKYLKDDGPHFNNVIYLAPDRTPEQQSAHRLLVKQLKEAIKNKPTRKWMIKFGKIVEAGEFVKRVEPYSEVDEKVVVIDHDYS